MKLKLTILCENSVGLINGVNSVGKLEKGIAHRRAQMHLPLDPLVAISS